MMAQILDLRKSDRQAKLAWQRYVLGAEQDCGAGDASACAALARAYDEGRVVTSDLQRSQMMLQRACGLGMELQGCSGP